MTASRRPNEQLRSARKLRGWSLDDVASRLQQIAASLGEAPPAADYNMVSRWERGVRSPGPRYVRLLCALFQLPADELGLAERLEPSVTPDRQVLQTLTALGLDVERRDFLRHLAALLGAATLAPVLDTASSSLGRSAARALTATPNSWNTEDPAFVVKCITAQYRRLDDAVITADLLGPVQSHLNFTLRLFNRTEPGPDRERLGAAVSEIAGLTAWLWIDLNNSTVARQHYLLAVYGAQHAQDDMLTAYMLGSLASLTTDDGASADGLALCDMVEQRLGTQTTPTAKVWSTALKAAALATTGERAATLRLLGSAEDLVQRAAEDGGSAWPWLYPFTADKLAATRATCELSLGQAAAKTALLNSLESPVLSSRQRGRLLIDLSNACLQVNDVDESCNALCQALDLAIQRRSHRLLKGIHTTRRRLDQWRAAAPVRQLDDRLKACTA